MEYDVYNGDYPFDVFLGRVYGNTPEEALSAAIMYFGKEHVHPVVSPADTIADIEFGFVH